MNKKLEAIQDTARITMAKTELANTFLEKALESYDREVFSMKHDENGNGVYDEFGYPVLDYSKIYEWYTPYQRDVINSEDYAQLAKELHDMIVSVVCVWAEGKKTASK